jgi:transcriptional regulator with PAS, ATPase and Fis domain
VTACPQVAPVGMPAPIIGISAAMQRARDLVARYAATGLPVLLVGPTGTGKELLAQHLHAASGRRGRLVPVNCGALPEHMAESLMFGHRRGSFSGAVESRRGYWEHANDGTLFLDELLSLPSHLQPKMLRALDSGEVLPLGEDSARYVRVRVVAAAQDDVATRLKDATLRADLYHRVAAVRIDLPPLVARLEDVVPLAEYFAGLGGRSLENGVSRILLQYCWPGNARELRFAIERAGRLGTNGTLSATAMAEAIDFGVTPSTGSPRSLHVRAIALEGPAAGWHAGRIALRLGVNRATVFRRLQAAGVTLRSLRQSQESRDGRATVAIPSETGRI